MRLSQGSSFKNQDDGICQYRSCGQPVPDSITIQLCAHHIKIAYAAHIITNGLQDLTQ